MTRKIDKNNFFLDGHAAYRFSEDYMLNQIAIEIRPKCQYPGKLYFFFSFSGLNHYTLDRSTHDTLYIPACNFIS